MNIFLLEILKGKIKLITFKHSKYTSKGSAYEDLILNPFLL